MLDVESADSGFRGDPTRVPICLLPEVQRAPSICEPDRAVLSSQSGLAHVLHMEQQDLPEIIALRIVQVPDSGEPTHLH